MGTNVQKLGVIGRDNSLDAGLNPPGAAGSRRSAVSAEASRTRDMTLSLGIASYAGWLPRPIDRRRVRS